MNSRQRADAGGWLMEEDWLSTIDKHLEGVEDAIQTNNLDLAEAELLAARIKLWEHAERRLERMR